MKPSLGDNAGISSLQSRRGWFWVLKRMEDHLRFAMACYWHTFCWNSLDMFGVGARSVNVEGL